MKLSWSSIDLMNEQLICTSEKVHNKNDMIIMRERLKNIEE